MVLQRKMVGKDQQDPASPFCTKQMKDITVQCNRLYSNLHTQVLHANVTSIAKCKQHYLQPNRKDLTTLHGRSYCALLAGEDIFFTAANGSSRILEDMYKQKHIKQKHILPSWNLSEGHTNSVAFTKHRTTLTAKKVVYQKLKRLVCTLPVGSRILGQRLTKYLLPICNHKTAKTFSQLAGPVSQLLNGKETKTDSKNQRVYLNNYMNTSKYIYI